MRGSVAKALRKQAKELATENNEYIAPKTMLTNRYVVHLKDGTTQRFPYNGTIRIREGSARRTYQKLKAGVK